MKKEFSLKGYFHRKEYKRVIAMLSAVFLLFSSIDLPLAPALAEGGVNQTLEEALPPTENTPEPELEDDTDSKDEEAIKEVTEIEVEAEAEDGTDPEDEVEVEEVIETDDQEIRLQTRALRMSPNTLGLAAGINRGLDTEEARTSDYVFFFDQDSRVPEGHIETMIRDWEEIAKKHRIGLLGPRFYDEITGTFNADAILDRDRAEGSEPYMPIGQMITSSMMTTYAIMKEIGFWNEELFLDYGDYDLIERG